MALSLMDDTQSSALPVRDCNDAVGENEASLEHVHVDAPHRVIQVKLHTPQGHTSRVLEKKVQTARPTLEQPWLG
jgi:hypothetical protein